MSHRDFDAEADERARDRDPITFKLGGHDFQARAEAPFGAVMDLRATPRVKSDPIGAGMGMTAFLQQVVIEEHAPNAAEAVRKAGPSSTYDLVEWLAEQYSGRPTVPSSESAVSPPADGRPSTSEPSNTATAA